MATATPRTLLTIEPTPAAPRNSEGAIVELTDGRLFLAYSRFTGGSHDGSTAHIAARVSTDRGRSWTDDATLVMTEGSLNVMSVSLVRLRSGDILFGYMIKNAWDDCKLFVRRSADDMATVGEAVCATPEPGYHVTNNDRLVQLRSGRLVAPAALHPCADGTWETWHRRGISSCFYSDDEGRTWHKSRSNLEAPAESETGLQEPGVVELTDGRLLMWMRTDLGCQYQSLSEDGGETWSPAQPGPLASPVSPASIKRFPGTGELLAVWNDHSGRHPFPAGRRTPLCVALSTDDGCTWTDSIALETDPDGWYCYTAIAVVGDDALLAYCAGDSRVGGLNRLKIAQVPREWARAADPGRLQ